MNYCKTSFIYLFLILSAFSKNLAASASLAACLRLTAGLVANEQVEPIAAAEEKNQQISEKKEANSDELYSSTTIAHVRFDQSLSSPRISPQRNPTSISKKYSSYFKGKSSHPSFLLLFNESYTGHTIIAINNELTAQFGYEESDLLGKTIDPFFESREQFVAHQRLITEKNISYILDSDHRIYMPAMNRVYLKSKSGQSQQYSVKIHRFKDAHRVIPNVIEVMIVRPKELDKEYDHEKNQRKVIIDELARRLEENHREDLQQALEFQTEMVRQDIRLLRRDNCEQQAFKNISVKKLLENIVFPYQEIDETLQVKINITDNEAVVDDMFIFTDPWVIETSIRNLLKNATYALDEHNTGKPKKITISFGRLPHHKTNNTEGFFQIKLSDNGPGIPEDIIANIFRRGTSTTGSGHGLATAKELVNTLCGSAFIRGKMSVRNIKNNDIGAEFIIEFFANLARSSLNQEIIQLPSSAGFVAEESKEPALNVLALVVDDDIIVRKILARKLQSIGFRVETFATAKSVLNRLRDDQQPRPDVIISDQNMHSPYLSDGVTIKNGDQLALAIKQDQRIKDIPFFLLSGNSAEDINPKAISREFCFIKPLKNSDLQTIINVVSKKSYDHLQPNHMAELTI